MYSMYCEIQALPAKPRLTNGGVEGESAESVARIADLQQALEQQVRISCLNVIQKNPLNKFLLCECLLF